jgi:hypothetical protein
MRASAPPELRKKKDDLCRFVMRLGTVVLCNVVEQRELMESHGSTLPPPLLAAITPVGVVGRLREISLRFGELSRDCCDADAAHGLEALSVELATEAESLEARLRISGADE